MNNRKQMTAQDRKGFGGLLIVIIFILFAIALLSRNWFAAFGIFVAFWMGALVVSLGYKK